MRPRPSLVYSTHRLHKRPWHDEPYQAPPARFERAACGFEVRRSVQLSYGGDQYTMTAGPNPAVPSWVSDGARTHNLLGHNQVP